MENRSALEPGFMLRQYRVDRVIGQGGFGITYLAFDTDLQRNVAIKECFPRDFVTREGTTIVPTGSKETQSFSWALGKFVSEATTLARFKHPGIVQVLQILKDENDSAYMILEFVEGTSFDKWLKSLNGNLDELMLKTVISPILDALEVVHEDDIAHLDIAPDNIYIRGNGDAVLLDFGAAKQTLGQQTRTLNLVVKDGYSSPEQYYVEGKQGPWSDVYAFAATLYRAIAGKRPVDAMARLDAINNDEKDPLTPLASMDITGFSKEFLIAIDEGMAAKTKARPQTIKEWRKTLIGEEFKNVSNDGGSNSSNESSTGAKQESSLGKLKSVLLAVILLASAVGGGVWYNNQRLIQIEESEWNTAVSLDRKLTYEEFAAKYPDSSRLQAAMQAINALQEPWTLSFNEAPTEHSNAVTANDETIIIVGTNAGISGNGFQAFVKATSLSGRMRWHSEYGNVGNETFEDVLLLSNGDVIAVGTSKPTPSSSSKALAVRFSQFGEQIWAKQLGGKGDSTFTAIDFLRNGDLIAVGSTGGKGVSDGWAVKLDSDGKIKDEIIIGGNGKDSFNDVEEMADGSLAFVGSKQRTGSTDANFWLVKVSPSGDILLDRSPGGIGIDQFNALAVTNSGELMIVGDTTSFGSNSVDAIIMRLTSDNKLPPKVVAEAKDDFLMDVAIATDGGVIVAGYTSSKGAGNTDGWVTKYNSSLTEIIWERIIGGKGVETIRGLHIIEGGSIVMVGSSQPRNAETTDVWALRLGARGQYDGN